jgi:hypothetical protein
MSNIFDFFLKEKGTATERNYCSEESIALDAEHEESVCRVLIPGGRQKTITVSQQSPYFTETTRKGFYSFTGDKYQARYAVNLLSDDESRIEPVSLFSQKSMPAQATASPMIVEVWQPLVFIALLTLLLEWSCYHRRHQ